MKKIFVLGVLGLSCFNGDVQGMINVAGQVDGRQEDRVIKRIVDAIRAEKNRRDVAEVLTKEQLSELPADAQEACRMLQSIKKDRRRLTGWEMDSESTMRMFVDYDDETELHIGRYQTTCPQKWTDAELEAGILIFLADERPEKKLRLDSSSVNAFASLVSRYDLKDYLEGVKISVLWNERRQIEPQELELFNIISKNVDYFQVGTAFPMITEDVVKVLKDGLDGGWLRVLDIKSRNCVDEESRKSLLELIGKYIGKKGVRIMCVDREKSSGEVPGTMNTSEQLECIIDAIRKERSRCDVAEVLTEEQLSKLPADGQKACRILQSLKKENRSLTDLEQGDLWGFVTKQDDEMGLRIEWYPPEYMEGWTYAELEAGILIFLADERPGKILWLDSSSVYAFSSLVSRYDLSSYLNGVKIRIGWNEDRQLESQELNWFNIVAKNVDYFRVEGRFQMVTKDVVKLLKEGFDHGCLRTLQIRSENCVDDETKAVLLGVIDENRDRVSIYLN